MLRKLSNLPKAPVLASLICEGHSVKSSLWCQLNLKSYTYEMFAEVGLVLLSDG